MPPESCAGHVPLPGICPSEQLPPLRWRFVACTCCVPDAMPLCSTVLVVAECIELDFAGVVDGKLVWVQLHSKEAISGLHFQFHRWNIEILVDQLGEGREVNHSGGDHH